MSNQVLHPTVTLRLYKGAQAYDRNGKLISENQTTKMTHGVGEWYENLKNLPRLGYTSAEVIKAENKVKGDMKPVDEDVLDAIKAEVEVAFKPTTEKAMTPDQKRIADLEAKLEALMGGKTPENDGKDQEIDPELTSLRERYTALAGKNGNKNWGVTRLKEEIAALEAAK